jgi:hypothetical protein
MRLTISALTASILALAIPGISHADDASPRSVLTNAVANGSASAPLDDNGQYAAVIAAVKMKTGSNGPLMIYATRVVTFREQPRCGRVAYVIGQPSANLAWPDMGGQLNICDNGDPPLRMCKGDPGKLVLSNSQCADRSAPVDTAEVAAAIRAALAAGGMTPEQAAKMVRQQQGGPSAAARGE